jgi:hypothetical protein
VSENRPAPCQGQSAASTSGSPAAGLSRHQQNHRQPERREATGEQPPVGSPKARIVVIVLHTKTNAGQHRVASKPKLLHLAVVTFVNGREVGGPYAGSFPAGPYRRGSGGGDCLGAVPPGGVASRRREPLARAFTKAGSAARTTQGRLLRQGPSRPTAGASRSARVKSIRCLCYLTLIDKHTLRNEAAMALSNAERQRRYRERLKGKLAHVAQAAATDPHSALRDALWKLYVTDDVATAESLAEAALRDLEARLAGWLASNTALDGEAPSDDQEAAFLDAWKAAIRISVPSIGEARRLEAEAKCAALGAHARHQRSL